MECLIRYGLKIKLLMAYQCIYKYKQKLVRYTGTYMYYFLQNFALFFIFLGPGKIHLLQKKKGRRIKLREK